jgi:hypothetical protein
MVLLLLEPDPMHRLTVEEAFKKPWISDHMELLQQLYKDEVLGSVGR